MSTQSNPAEQPIGERERPNMWQWRITRTHSFPWDGNGWLGWLGTSSTYLFRYCVSWTVKEILYKTPNPSGASLIAQLVKNLPAMWETWVRSLGWEDALEKRENTPVFWPGEFHGLKVRHDWATFTFQSYSSLKANITIPISQIVE